MTCKHCAYWEPDIDPETGVGIHRCDCCASPRLDDVTRKDDGCEYAAFSIKSATRRDWRQRIFS